ncbi:MAG: type II toxin-antitoxin system HicB family antitoxin [Acidobacteriota bacterium]
MNLLHLLGRPSQPDCQVKLAVAVIVEPDGDEFHAFCPALKGLHVSGGSVPEALENAKEAVELYLMSLVKHGDPFPIGPDLTTEQERQHEQFQVPVGALLRNLELQWPIPHTSGAR